MKTFDRFRDTTSRTASPAPAEPWSQRAEVRRILTAPRVQPEQTAAPVLRRKVLQEVEKSTQTNAQVALVHLHRDEQNALEVAKEMHGTYCSNLVHLKKGTGRYLKVEVTPTKGGKKVKETCKADPNRIFTDSGIKSNAIQKGCSADARPLVEADLKDFRDTKLRPAIDGSRKGKGSTPLPIVSFHNNAPGGTLTIKAYESGGDEAGAAETDTKRLKGATNPSVVKGEDPDNFFLVTDPADFAALGAKRNTVLQSASPTDDGSLSVAFAGDRYINVEAEGKPFKSKKSVEYVTNRDMAVEALTQLGVGKVPCP